MQMPNQLSRRRFLQVAATASGSVVGFDPQTRLWVLAGQTRAKPFSQIPKLDGNLLYDDASRSAVASDGGNIVHRMPAAVLKPGSLHDVISIVQYANRHSLKVAM